MPIRDYAAMVLANYMFGGSIPGRAPNRIPNPGKASATVSLVRARRAGNAASFVQTPRSPTLEHAESGSQLCDELAKTLATGFNGEEARRRQEGIAPDQRAEWRTSRQRLRLLNLIAAREEFGARWPGA